MSNYHIPSEFIKKVCPDRGDGYLGDKGHNGIYDNSKIKRYVPEFKCTVSFAEGIRRSLAYVEKHPELKKPSKLINDDVEKILGKWKKVL